MKHDLFWARQRRGLALLLAGTIFVLAPAAAVGQQAGQVKVFFWPEAKKPDNVEQGYTTLLLRPNVTQQFFLFIYNGGKDELKNVVVELRAGGKPAGTVNVASLPAGTQAVSFASPAPPVPPPGGKPPALNELAGSVEVVALLDKKELAKAVVSVGRPSTYVRATDATFDREARTLKITVSAGPTFSGPRCRVDLELRPERIPFFDPKQKRDGSYGGFLTKPGDKLELEARNLRLLPSEAPGLAYLTVDGYERAFTFRVTNTSEKINELKEVPGPILQLTADRVAAAGGPSKVRFEADYLAPRSQIELGLYRDDSFKPEKRDGELLVYTGERHERILFSPQGPDGGLLFRTEVADWTTELDTAKVFGGRILRLRLLEDGKQARFTGVTPGGGTRGDLTAITAGLILDGSPPEDVQFVDFPKELPRGSLLTLKATGRDPESGIRQVVFFAGKLTPDGKIPPTAVQAAGEKVKDKDLWVADLAVQTDKAATLDVTVQFTNGVGLTTTEAVVIKLVDAKAGGGTATIKGAVVEGDRPQAGLEVTLRDPMGAPKDVTQTDDDGKFVFKNVAPGTYQITVGKTGSRTQGQAAVQVVAGEEKELKAPIKLTR